MQCSFYSYVVMYITVEELSFSRTMGKSMQASIFCPNCHQLTSLSLVKNQLDSPCSYAPSIGILWWIGICNGCKEPCLVLNEASRVYPNPLPSNTSTLIPQHLREDLIEAKQCFAVGCYRACAVMARRCVQNTCIDKGAQSSNLVQQIQELTQLGVITKDIEEWAHVVRWIGNDAAHVNKDPVLKEDAEDCLQLAEQLLHVVYVTPAIAKAQRSARNK